VPLQGLEVDVERLTEELDDANLALDALQNDLKTDRNKKDSVSSMKQELLALRQKLAHALGREQELRRDMALMRLKLSKAGLLEENKGEQ